MPTVKGLACAQQSLKGEFQCVPHVLLAIFEYFAARGFDRPLEGTLRLSAEAYAITFTNIGVRRLRWHRFGTAGTQRACFSITLKFSLERHIERFTSYIKSEPSVRNVALLRSK